MIYLIIYNLFFTFDTENKVRYRQIGLFTNLRCLFDSPFNLMISRYSDNSSSPIFTPWHGGGLGFKSRQVHTFLYL